MIPFLVTSFQLPREVRSAHAFFTDLFLERIRGTMTSFTNWEAKWVSLGLVGASPHAEASPHPPWLFLRQPSPWDPRGGGNRHRDTPCALSTLLRPQGAWEEVEHLVSCQETHGLIKNVDQEVNRI